MPRPPSDLIAMGVRIPAPIRNALDDRAQTEGLTDERTGRPNRSAMAHIALAYALAHMPPGWRPETDA